MNAMEKILGSIQDNRILILLTEIGALIHDLGKLSSEFVRVGVKSKTRSRDRFDHYLFLKRFSSETDPYMTGDKKDLIRAAQSWLRNLRDPEIGVFPPDLKEFMSNFANELDQFEDSALDGKVDEFCKKQENSLLPLHKEVIAYFVKLNSKLADKIGKEKKISDNFVSANLKNTLNDERWENILKEQKMCFYTKRMADFIEMHHDTWHYPFSPLIELIKAEARGCDAVDSEADKGVAKHKQNLSAVIIDTAFGYKSSQIHLPGQDGQDELAKKREKLCIILVNALQDVLRCPQDEKVVIGARKVILSAAKEHFPFALGETRWAANDVTLWNHSYSVASFYKALLAKVLIEGKMPSNLENVNWRILRVAFDGLAILSRARRIGDILGYREMLDKLKEKIKAVEELETPRWRPSRENRVANSSRNLAS